jgi:small subunit ribosomal protein S14
MAKKSMIQREEKRARLLAKYTKKRESIKQSLRTTTSYQEKIDLSERLAKIPKNASPVRRRNRCWVTGRSRGFYRDFGLSRHVLREMAHDGMIPGLKKASW